MRGLETQTRGLLKATLGLDIPTKTRRTMDVGARGGKGALPLLLGVYDTSGALSTQDTFEIPLGCARAVIRTQGGGGGGGWGSDTGYGSDPRVMIMSAGSGANWAKRTIELRYGMVLTTSLAGGGSVYVDGSIVCAALNGTLVGDIIRYGGPGGGPGEGGGTGDHGAYGGPGGSGSGYYPILDIKGALIRNAYYTELYGGGGGSAGDFGDPDGVGFGWNPVTGARLAGSFPARITIHYYSQ